jgi:hypothetical protein
MWAEGEILAKGQFSALLSEPGSKHTQLEVSSSAFSHHPAVHNRRIGGGEGRRRPGKSHDLLDLGSEFSVSPASKHV